MKYLYKSNNLYDKCVFLGFSDMIFLYFSQRRMHSRDSNLTGTTVRAKLG